ncbi:MAG: hypothetical protein AAF755_07750 [Pseudomonadota bacterium]
MKPLLLTILVVFVGVSVVAGLMAVGGPGFARMERADAQRSDDIIRIAEYHRCQNLVEDVATVSTQNSCARRTREPTPRDPLTDAPYAYTRIDENALSVCAQFQTDTRNRHSRSYSRLTHREGSRGCVFYERESPRHPWNWRVPDT